MTGQPLAIGVPAAWPVRRRASSTRRAMRRPGGTLAALLVLYACWGSSVPAMKVVATTMPPLATAGMVFLLGGLILGVAAAARPASRPTRAQASRATLAGLLLFVGGQGLATLVLTRVSASVVALLVATIPLWMALLSGLGGTRIGRAGTLRLLIGFGGIASILLTAPGAALGGSGIALVGACIAPVLWAGGSVVAARAGAMPRDPRVNGAIQLLAGGIALVVLAAATGELAGGRWIDTSTASLSAALFLLFADSLIGFLVYAHLLRTAPMPLVSTYAYVTPIVAAVLGFVALGEPFWLGALLGATVVIGAVAAEVRAR